MKLMELDENVEENDPERDENYEGEDWLKNEIANFNKETNDYLEASETRANETIPSKLFTYENWGKVTAPKVSLQKFERPASSSSVSCSYDENQSRKEKLSLYGNFLKIVELRKKSSDRFKWKAINRPNLFQPIVPSKLITPRSNPSPRVTKTNNIMKKKKGLNERTETMTSPKKLSHQDDIFPEILSLKKKITTLVSIAYFYNKMVGLVHIYHSKRDKAARLISFRYRIFYLTRLIKASFRIKFYLWRRKKIHSIRLIQRFIEDRKVPNYRKSIKAFLLNVKKCQIITRTMIQINKSRRILLQLYWNKLEIVLKKKHAEEKSSKRQQIRKAGAEERGGVSDKWYQKKQHVQNYLVYMDSVELRHDKAARVDERYKKKHTIVEIKTNNSSFDLKTGGVNRKKSTICDLGFGSDDIIESNVKPILPQEWEEEGEEAEGNISDDNISEHSSLPSERRGTVARLSISQPVSRKGTIARLSISQPASQPIARPSVSQPVDTARLSISESSLPVSDKEEISEGQIRTLNKPFSPRKPPSNTPFSPRKSATLNARQRQRQNHEDFMQDLIVMKRRLHVQHVDDLIRDEARREFR
jgi:hypothetical protein